MTGQDHYQLQCMDIWSGNQQVENHISTPGLDLFVYSRPWQGQRTGGDVHYVSLCAGGSTTRLMLADVSGHGEAVAETSRTLRNLMRKFMNHKSQTRLVRELNREFSQLTQVGRFATAVIATYLTSGNHLRICNAGHPRPLAYRHATRQWSFPEPDLVPARGIFNLPLGIDETTAYQQVSLPLSEGDLVILYTDAVTEASNASGNLLGEEGLLKLVNDLPCDDARIAGQALLKRLSEYAGEKPLEDDVTLLVMRYTRERRRFPGLVERFKGYARFLGLQPV